MKFQVLINLIKQGFQGMWRNRGMGVASVASIAAVLMILGIVIVLILSINNIVMNTRAQFDQIDVFLEDDITDEEIAAIEETALENEGIVQVEYKPREDALEEMKESWGDESYLLEGLEENPLPDTFIITIDDIVYSDSVVSSMTGLAGVEEVSSYEDAVDNLINIANYIKIGGISIIAILALISVFIISNTIKLTVVSRKREINIMKFIGATNGYIRGPFVIEGLMFGLLGAILSIIVVYFGYVGLFDTLNNQLFAILAGSLISPELILSDVLIMFLSIGAGIGVLGSMVSVKRYLNV